MMPEDCPYGSALTNRTHPAYLRGFLFHGGPSAFDIASHASFADTLTGVPYQERSAVKGDKLFGKRPISSAEGRERD